LQLNQWIKNENYPLAKNLVACVLGVIAAVLRHEKQAFEFVQKGFLVQIMNITLTSKDPKILRNCSKIIRSTSVS
jgi:hypothetical protein